MPLTMTDIDQKVAAVTRDSRTWINSYYYDSEKNQVVFQLNSDNQKEFRLGYNAVMQTPHSTIIEWVRAIINGMAVQ